MCKTHNQEMLEDRERRTTAILLASHGGTLFRNVTEATVKRILSYEIAAATVPT